MAHHNAQRHYEFCGPRLGPLGIMVGLPVVLYGLVATCNARGCLTLWPRPQLPGWPLGTPLFTWQACGVWLGWLAFQVAVHLLVPGRQLQGTELRDGRRLTYKLTGRPCIYNLVITLTAAAVLGLTTDKLAWVHANFVPLMTASLLFSFALSAWLYASSLRGDKMLAPHFVPATNGHSGSGTDGRLNSGKASSSGKGSSISTESSEWARQPIYEFFMGRELNPRIGSLDLKEFCELYPGMIGWAVLNLGMMQAEHLRTGHVSMAMVLVVAFQLLYIADSVYFEPSILTTMDIVSDGFGFMLVFGDLTWVPFTYCLQARYLADHSQTLSWAAISGILLLKAAGYVTFRGSNSQKDQFRRDPEHPAVRGLRSIRTERGRLLLVSGWWGVARHINYFGDWLMAWAWCLPCGFDSIISYFYVIYFGILLVHRDRRDCHSCQLKYGKDWDKYKTMVRYRIVPLLY